MEAYVNFTQHGLNFFGIVQLRGPERRTNKLLSSLVTVTSIAILIQSLVQLLLNEGSLDAKTLGLAMFTSRMQAPGKIIALVSNRSELRKCFNKLNEMIQNSNAESKKANDKYMRQMFRINLKIIKFYVFAVLLYLFKPMIVMAIAYLKTGEILQTTPYPFWYPFEQVSYAYYLTYLYEIYVGMVIMIFPFATDQLFLILVVLASNQFKSFGSELLRAIEEKQDNVKIKKEIKVFVETHNELIEICKFLNQMYSIPIFIHIITSTFTICMIEFIIAVGGLDKQNFV